MLQVSEQIGKMDREITFLQGIYENGDSNEDKLIGWEEIDDYPTVSAAKIENRGGELALADRVTHTQTTTFLIRYRSDISNRMRVVCDERVYEIISTVEEGRRRFLTVVTNLIDNVFWT